MSVRSHHFKKSLRRDSPAAVPVLAAYHPETPRKPEGIAVSQLAGFQQGWINDGMSGARSATTLENRRRITNNLMWWCRTHNIEILDRARMSAFLAYVANGTAAGRWGRPQFVGPATKSTNDTYFAYLHAWFGWLHDLEVINYNPLTKATRVGGQTDQIQPFTEDGVIEILAAAEKTNHPLRDLAIVWVLFDTGVRVSELCSLTRGDVNIMEKSIFVRKGKGKKSRTLYFGQITGNALWRYLREVDLPDLAPLFPSDRGGHAGEALDRHGVKLMLRRLNERIKEDQAVRGERATGINRLTPHTFRHTFAVSFLRNGGNVYELMRLLGHKTLTMSLRYSNIAEVDIAEAHRRNSPADRLSAKRRTRRSM